MAQRRTFESLIGEIGGAATLITGGTAIDSLRTQAEQYTNAMSGGLQDKHSIDTAEAINEHPEGGGVLNTLDVLADTVTHPH